jgi:hypothetical protein
LTPRERVLLAVAHRRTDRAPANYGAHKEVSDRLIQRLGLKDGEDLLRALNVDMRRISINYNQPNAGPDTDGYVRTMWGLRSRKQCERYHGEYATFGAPWSPFFHEVGWLIGQEKFFVLSFCPIGRPDSRP